MKAKWEFRCFLTYQDTKEPWFNHQSCRGTPCSCTTSALFQCSHHITNLTCFPPFLHSNSNNSYPVLTFSVYFYFAQLLKAVDQMSGRQIISSGFRQCEGIRLDTTALLGQPEPCVSSKLPRAVKKSQPIPDLVTSWGISLERGQAAKLKYFSLKNNCLHGSCF